MVPPHPPKRVYKMKLAHTHPSTEAITTTCRLYNSQQHSHHHHHETSTSHPRIIICCNFSLITGTAHIQLTRTNDTKCTYQEISHI